MAMHAFFDGKVSDEEICTFLKERPQLSQAGWGGNTNHQYSFRENNAEAIREIRESMEWIQRFGGFTRRINYSYSSYVLKHLVEQSTPNEYISNGAFIAAALLLGYKYVITSNGVNCCFNMRIERR
jgi:hypothetical protein